MRILGLSLIVTLAVTTDAWAQTEYPAIFDDFDYKAAPSTGAVGNEQPSVRSLFGRNRWITGEYTSTVSRAWRRFNWDDNGTVGTYSFSEPGVLRIQVPIFQRPQGFGASNHYPGIMSGFLMGDGTYAAHVRFSRVPNVSSGHFMSAFWAMSPGKLGILTGADTTYYWSESDFEWNSWGNYMSMAVGNHASSSSSNVSDLDCGAWDGANHVMPGCTPRDNLSLADRWVYLVFTVEKGRRSSWYLYSPDSGVSYWGGRSNPSGSLPTWNGPRISTSFVPKVDMAALFSIHWPKGKPYDRLAHPVHLDVNYFYYSPHVFINSDNTIDLDGVRAQVDLLRAKYRPIAGIDGLGLRVNTLGGAFYHEVGASTTPPPRPKIVDLSTGNDMGRWRLELVPTGDSQIAEVWRYRTFHCDGSYSSWKNVDEDELVLPLTRRYPLSGITQVQLEARVRSLWQKGLSPLRTHYTNVSGTCSSIEPCGPYRLCPLESRSEIPLEYSFDGGFPNPFVESTTIRIGLPEASFVRVTVVNLLGKEMAEIVNAFLPSGYHAYSIGRGNWSSGIYIVTVTAHGDNGEVFQSTRKITLIR